MFYFSLIAEGVDFIVLTVLLLVKVMLVVSPQGVTHWKLKDGDVVPASDARVLSHTNGMFAPQLDPLFDVLMSNLHSQPTVTDGSINVMDNREPEGSSCHQRADACSAPHTSLPSNNEAMDQKKEYVHCILVLHSHKCYTIIMCTLVYHMRFRSLL